MKINGSGQPPTPGGVEGVAGNDAPGGVAPAADEAVSETGRAFAEKLARTAPAPGVETSSVGSPSAVPVRDLASEIESGRLGSRAAMDQLIERVLDLQLGADAPAAMRDRVQTALRDALDSDPLLAAKLGQLSGPGFPG